jgi:uncharacterized protein (DUF885 family)
MSRFTHAATLDCANVSGMGAKTRALLFAACLLATCLQIPAFPGLAPTPSSVESRIAAQNALFEEQYQSDLKAYPELATAIGDYRSNDQLGDRSLAAIENRHAADEDFLARLNAIPSSGFSEQDALSRDVMIRTLQQRIDNYSSHAAELIRMESGKV